LFLLRGESKDLPVVRNRLIELLEPETGIGPQQQGIGLFAFTQCLPFFEQSVQRFDDFLILIEPFQSPGELIGCRSFRAGNRGALADLFEQFGRLLKGLLPIGSFRRGISPGDQDPSVKEFLHREQPAFFECFDKPLVQLTRLFQVPRLKGRFRRGVQGIVRQVPLRPAVDGPQEQLDRPVRVPPAELGVGPVEREVLRERLIRFLLKRSRKDFGCLFVFSL
jgi:hypothetical protein